MVMIDHWHPVLKSNELRNKPVGIQLDGHGVVLYRTRPGTLAALADECPHRRLRLSLGDVVGEKLRCRYPAGPLIAQAKVRALARRSSRSASPLTMSWNSLARSG
jgi:hypothetical protein